MILFHRDSACNGPALNLLHNSVARFHDDPSADSVLKLDGTKPLRGEAMFCGSCKRPVYPWQLDK